MEIYTSGFVVASFTENTKNSLEEIIRRMRWKLEKTEGMFHVTYPAKDDSLIDFLFDRSDL